MFFPPEIKNFICLSWYHRYHVWIGHHTLCIDDSYKYINSIMITNANHTYWHKLRGNPVLITFGITCYHWTKIYRNTCLTFHLVPYSARRTKKVQYKLCISYVYFCCTKFNTFSMYYLRFYDTFALWQNSGLKETHLYRLCNETKETISPLFWECTRVRNCSSF